MHKVYLEENSHLFFKKKKCFSINISEPKIKLNSSSRSPPGNSALQAASIVKEETNSDEDIDNFLNSNTYV